MKRGDRVFQELSKSRRVDFTESVSNHGDRLPRPALIIDAHTLLRSIDLQAGGLIEGRNAELRHEIGVFKSILADAEGQPHQPLLSRRSVQEPTVTLCWRGNFHLCSTIP